MVLENAVDTSSEDAEKRTSKENEWEQRKDAFFPFSDTDPGQYDEAVKAVEADFDKKLLSSEPIPLDFENWNGDISRRHLKLNHSGLTFHCFGTASEKKRLFIFLAGGGGEIKTGETPNYNRVSWHPWCEGVCVNLGDPTFIAYPNKLKTGWYIGAKEQDALPLMIEIVRKLQSYYQIPDEEVYTIGSSAGGTSALKLAASLPGATAIAENPPPYAHRRATSRYFSNTNIDLSSPEFLERTSLKHIVNHPNSRFFIFQNWTDTDVVESLLLFLKEAGLPPPKLGLNTFGSFNLYCAHIPNRSPHHSFLSVDEFRIVLRGMDRSLSQSTRASLLHSASSALRARIINSDNITHLKVWANFLTALRNSNLIVIPAPSGDQAIKFPLKIKPGLYYTAKLSHGANALRFSINVRSQDLKGKARILEEIGLINGIKITEKDGTCNIALGGVSLAHAPSKFHAFVQATSSIFTNDLARNPEI